MKTRTDLLTLAREHQALVAFLDAVNAALVYSSRREDGTLLIPRPDAMLAAVQHAAAVCGGYAEKGGAK